MADEQPLLCRCEPTHQRRPFNPDSFNAPALARLASLRATPREVDCLILPGYTPTDDPPPPGTLNAKAIQRCNAVIDDLRKGVAPVVIVSGAAVHSDDNEAIMMRAQLMGANIEHDRILIDPCARHSTTNLRNAGRMMLALGLHVAYIVTSDASWPARFIEQAYYFGWPTLSTFNLRCQLDLGYTVGQLEWVRTNHIRFVPSPDCNRESPKATAEDDP
jgi:hypothetical protein